MRLVTVFVILSGLVAAMWWIGKSFATSKTPRGTSRLAVGTVLLLGGILSSGVGFFVMFGNSMMPGGPENTWQPAAVGGGFIAMIVGLIVIAKRPNNRTFKLAHYRNIPVFGPTPKSRYT